MKVETGLICNLKMTYKGHVVDPGRCVRFARHMRGYECKELANKVKISAGYLSNIERNRTLAPVKTYDRIASGLGLTTDELFRVTPVNWNK